MTIRQLMARAIRMSRKMDTGFVLFGPGRSVHRALMQVRSLTDPDLASSEQDVKFWHQEITQLLGRSDFYMVCEPICDGFAVSLAYENGILTKIVAVGGGPLDHSITDTLRKVPGVPKRLAGTEPGSYLEVLGNLYVPLPDIGHEAGERSSLKLLANGISSSAGGRVPSNQWAALAYLKSLGFDVSRESRLARSPQEVMRRHQTLAESANSRQYPCAGMTVKVNRFDHQSLLAEQENTAAWAISYGFPDVPYSHQPGKNGESAQPTPARRQPLRGLSVAVEIESDKPSAQQVEEKVVQLGGSIVRDTSGKADYIITDSPQDSMSRARPNLVRAVGVKEFVGYCNRLQVISRLDEMVAGA